MSAPIPLAGVIGHPVGHSLSPRLHGHWLHRMNLRGHYVPLEVPPDDLPQVLATLPKAGFVGVNITIPHKAAALALASEATDRAQRIGAANTLTFLPGGGIHADNTDGEGFLANLQQAAPDWKPASGPAAIFGAGGAARAVLDALLTAGVPEIRLANRTVERADALAMDFGPCIRVMPWSASSDVLDGAKLAVNTTALGMEGQPSFDLDVSALRPGALATDIVYTPLQTPFLTAAAARGARTVDGLGMLLWQARPGFTRWFGAEPDVDDTLRQAVLAP